MCRVSRPDRWEKRGNVTTMVRPDIAACRMSFDALPGPAEVDIARSALIVIDMQNDFLHPEGWFASARGADVEPLGAITGNINALADQFRACRSTVIHLNWGVRADLANLPANVVDKASDCGRGIGYADELVNGPVLVADSWGAQSVPAIRTCHQDIHVSKQRLSGFSDNELDQLLRRRRVDTLFFTGINIDRCVFATLADACFQGYDAVLVEDACATTSPACVTDAITYLVRLVYGFTATTDSLLAGFNQLQPVFSGDEQ
jgi:ureidoacrylate peracid hydrolase